MLDARLTDHAAYYNQRYHRSFGVWCLLSLFFVLFSKILGFRVANMNARRSVV